MNDDNGLNLTEDAFMSMKSKEQMLCLYRNQVETLRLIRGYRFHQKAQYITLGLLTAGLVYLVQLHII